MSTRRAFLSGFASLVAAPAVIRTPGLLMPVRPIVPVSPVAIIVLGWAGCEIQVGDLVTFVAGSGPIDFEGRVVQADPGALLGMDAVTIRDARGHERRTLSGWCFPTWYPRGCRGWPA